MKSGWDASGDCSESNLYIVSIAESSNVSSVRYTPALGAPLEALGVLWPRSTRFHSNVMLGHKQEVRWGRCYLLHPANGFSTVADLESLRVTLPLNLFEGSASAYFLESRG